MNATASGIVWTAALSLSLGLSACGGGGGGGGGATIGGPPAGLSYATPTTYEAHAAIASNAPSSAGGTITSYSVAPPLPSGLALDPVTGVIAGTPAAITAAADYVVTGANAQGSTQATVNVGVTPGSQSLAEMPATAITDADIRYFLGRTWFGGTTADFDAAKAAGVSAFVDQMTTFTTDPTLEAAADAILVNTSPPDPVGLEGKFPSTSQLRQRSLYLMLHTANPFQEVLGFFWHDHFAASQVVLDGDAKYWMKAHMDLWRNEGIGNLRTLLVDMARDWVMLDWLSGDQSTKYAPNENFGREFWELFTLGVDNGYVQSDITTVARAWTGYRRRYDVPTGSGLSIVEFDPTRHDTGAKSFFGQTIPGQNSTDDYQAVVDITLAQKPVAEFICKKLFEYFCYQAPPNAPVDAMAAMLRTSGPTGYDLKPVLRALLKSEAFFSAKSKAGQVKSPIETAVGFIRQTNLQIRVSTLSDTLANMGQVPTEPPTVNGWPDNTQWLSAQAMLDRANVVLTCINARNFQATQGISVASLLPPPYPATPSSPTSGEVVDALATLLHVTLSTQDRSDCVAYLDAPRPAPDNIPFDPTNATHLDMRVRGLLYILAQNPSYQIR